MADLGNPVQIGFLSSLAFNIACERSTTGQAIKAPGKNWTQRFQKRNPKSKSNISRANSRNREASDTLTKCSRSSKGNPGQQKAKKSSVCGDSNKISFIQLEKSSHDSTSTSPGDTSESKTPAWPRKMAVDLSARTSLHTDVLSKEERIRRESKERKASQKRYDEKKCELVRAEVAKQVRLALDKVAKEDELKRQQEEDKRKEREREEEERALYDEQQRQRHDEIERRREEQIDRLNAEIEKLLKQQREERRSKLPLLPRWFDALDETATLAAATLFKSIPGYRYDTLVPEATGAPNGRDLWMLNTHVALLLGGKDLQLSRCKFTG